MNTPSLKLLCACLPLALAACGGADESDEFTEAIPSASTMSLSLSDDADGALTQALVTDPSTIRERAREVADAINGAVASVHERIDALIAESEPSDEDGDAERRRCKAWEQSRDGVDYRLRSCRLDRRAQRFAFFLQGKLSESTEYLPLAGGHGVILPRFEGKRRGAGRMAYNFDNLRELTGVGPQGKVGVGYRHAGRARQLNLGLLAFQRADADQPLSARYHFVHVRGVGGLLRHVRAGDFLVRDESQELVLGTDGVAELGRIAMGWSSTGAARVVAAACGGTVGEGQCVRVVHCYDAVGASTYEDVGAEGVSIQWEETACPAVPFPILEAPRPTDVNPPQDSDGGEVPGPSMDEPAALPEQE